MKQLIGISLALLFSASCSEENTPCACPAYEYNPSYSAEEVQPLSVIAAPYWQEAKATEQPEVERPLPIGSMSYDLLKQYLNRDTQPPYWLISPSEIINAFSYDSIYSSTKNHLTISYEIHPAPWATNKRLVRLVVNSGESLLSHLNYSLSFQTDNVLSYRILDVSESKNASIDNMGLAKSQSLKQDSQQTTIFVEITLRPERKPPIVDLHLFNFKLLVKDNFSDPTVSIIDHGEGLLTASRDFYFSSGLAWWSLIMMDRLYVSSFEWDIKPHMEFGLDPDNYPEREDIFKWMKKYFELYNYTEGWCRTPDYWYNSICEC